MEKKNIEKVLSSRSSFCRKVLKVTATIPYGQTRSYQWVARTMGNPLAYRAVGQALAKNPLPGIIPCHRVIKTDGNVGGYSLGSKKKERLLIEEVIHLKKGRERRYEGKSKVVQ